ncbi:Fic family protein [Acidovorax sp. YS12]|nr:Fic family protein [Acidovorax sp. YS12]
MVTPPITPAALEPLLPRVPQADGLLGKARDLQMAAARLSGACQNGANAALANLLPSMNAYYSNKIEGEHASPLEIARALAGDFSPDVDRARRQQLAVAHVEAERWLQASSQSAADLYSPPVVRSIHSHILRPLAPDGEPMPRALRICDVTIGRHIAPGREAPDAMLQRWAEVYGGVRRGETQIVAAAAAHHRLAWMHPFADGNGRVVRLHTWAVLQSLGLAPGLWSPLRGLARSGGRYNQRLSDADQPRQDELDGPGPLSERMLVAWIDFFLDMCLEEVRFMQHMFHRQDMLDRLKALLVHEEQVGQRGLRMEALLPLHYLFATQGAVTRGDFAAMTGLGERTATTLIRKLLEAGLLQSGSPRGLVRFGVPMDMLRFLLPNLWPEAEAAWAE